MDDVEAGYGVESERFIRTRFGRGYLVRIFGGAFADTHLDATVLGESLARIGRATSWFNNSLFGRRTVPGVEYAARVASVVVSFTAAPDEELLRDDSREVAPTAVSGHVLASLLRADEPQIVEAAQHLRPRATGVYLTALQELAEREASVEWVLLDGARPRRLTTSRGQIVDTIDVLEQPVETQRRHIGVSGIVYAADQYTHSFRMDVTGGELQGRTIRGSFGSAASETLEGAWRRAVDATLAVIEPAKPGLPRAPRTRYELVRVERVRFDEPVPTDPVHHIST
jgi:hypothetical protein